MKGLLALVAALGAVASAQEYEVLLANDTDDHVGLNDAARASGRYMGTATEYLNVAAQTADTFYVDELKNPKQWGAVTSANLMKAMYLQPTQGNFTYEKADEFVRFAKHQGYKVRCHTLVWYYENPTWMSKGNWTKDELKNILTDHITNVISHFGDDCYSWDVVNEATAHDVNTAAYRTNFWYNTIGPEYVAHAFTVANQVKAKLGLKVKLYYNDYFIEYGGTPKATFAYNLVKGLLDQGVKVDGVGMQNHFFVGQVPSKDTLISVMKSYTDLGLDVASTELDLPILMPPSMAMQQQQVQDYNTIVGACKAVEKCVGVTLWDFVDTYSWIPGVYTGYGSANPWYQKNSTGPLIRKGGYDGIVAAWGIPLYGRCGGSGWNGPTNCAEGKCTVKNSFYSQCLN